MNLDKAKKKYKIYKWINISMLLFWFVYVALIFMENASKTLITILAIMLIPLIITHKIIINKQKYYKKLVYDLSINENAIKETINNKHLK